MQKITEDTISELLAIEATPKVTIYMPLEVSSSPPHMTENQIRFKNLIHKVDDQLEERGDTSKLGRELCDYLEEVLHNPDFWKDKSAGLLLCAVPGMMKIMDLPVDTEEYVSVDNSFHLAPILALIGDAREYYVLSIAQQDPQIYKGDMYGLEKIDIGLPATMRSGLGIDEPNQQSENQGSAVGTSMQTGWYNGRGGARDPQDNDRMKFFHLIDKLLHDNLDRQVPLILAGIDAEIAEFRSISKYPNILEGSIPGNHNDTRTGELFEKAQAIVVRELVRPEHMAAKEEYERLSGANPDKVAGDNKSITEAAEQGRVDKLLASMSRDTRDTVRDNIESVLRITFPEPEVSKTMNNLATKVWQMSGKVISLLPSEMPNGSLMVARLRY